MEQEFMKEAKTTPMDVSMEQEIKQPSQTKPMEASVSQEDKKEDLTTPFNTSGQALIMVREDKGNPEAPADATVLSLSGERKSKEEDGAIAEADIKELPVQKDEHAEMTAKPSSLSHSFEKEKNNSDTSAETSNKLLTAKKKTVRSLKARAMIRKNVPAINLTKKKVKLSNSKTVGKKDMKKTGALLSKGGVSRVKGQDAKESTSIDKTLQENLSNVKRTKKNNEMAIQEKGGESKPNSRGEDTKVPTSGEKEHQDNSVIRDNHKRNNPKNKKKASALPGNKKRKLEDRKKFQSSERVENAEKKDDANDTEENRNKEGNKKKWLGGLIFMCSSQTKPDCLKYRVMGVSMGKKDLVMAIRPGLKLFLFDYDLKLLYGIYKASSAGGIKLEPRAFKGNFPVQVRFSVHVECHPLPVSVFKKAMQENFNSRDKFKTELTVKQVRKLSKLFQPVALHLDALDQPKEVPDHAPQRARTGEENSRAREREPRRKPINERSGRDSYANREARRHRVRVNGRNHWDLSPLRRTGAPRELFLTEREYRAYGLQGDRRDLTIAGHVDPALLPHERYYEGRHLARRADEVRRDAVPRHSDSVLAGRSYLDNIDYRTYSRDSRPELSPAVSGRSIGAAYDYYLEDPYGSYRRSAASLDHYSEHMRREGIPSSSSHAVDRSRAHIIESDRVRRRKADPIESRSIYAADALPKYDRSHHYRVPAADVSRLPVSSRYSFGGPRI